MDVLRDNHKSQSVYLILTVRKQHAVYYSKYLNFKIGNMNILVDPISNA